MARLGDYIEQVNVRNRDLKVTKLLGVSINKVFMPSIANTIGTDMSNYKVVKNEQFAYGPVTSRNGDKVSIALLDSEEDVIISQAYITFEVKDKSKLLPQYLMMWFRRPEFDRYARFHSNGSAREMFDWEELCEVNLPIPPIEKQKSLVKDYTTLTSRISLNERLIATLESTAQTLYRKTFVDNIDPENLPEGWKMGKLEDVADFVYGKLPNKNGGDVPVYSGYAITGYTNVTMFDDQHIVVIARGDAGSGKICLSPTKFFLTNLAIAVLLKNESMKYYLYYYLKNSDTSVLRSGSAQAQVTINSLLPFKVMIPSLEICSEFEKQIQSLETNKEIKYKEIDLLKELQVILLANMIKDCKYVR